MATNVTDGPTGRLLPFYLLADVSYSMVGEKIDQVNAMLPELADALIKNPIVSDKVRFSLIDFADDSTVPLPLCDLNKVDDLPGLTVRGGTSYAAAFRMLRSSIATDSAQLKADGYQVVRPAAFFISDGAPTDDEKDWRGAFEDLTFYDREAKEGNPQYPNMIPFGVDAADRDTLLSIVHPATGPKRMKLYMMAEGATAGSALAQMAEVLIASVLRSGDAVNRGSGGIVLPSEDELGEGIEQIDPEDLI